MALWMVHYWVYHMYAASCMKWVRAQGASKATVVDAEIEEMLAASIVTMKPQVGWWMLMLDGKTLLLMSPGELSIQTPFSLAKLGVWSSFKVIQNWHPTTWTQLDNQIQPLFVNLQHWHWSTPLTWSWLVAAECGCLPTLCYCYMGLIWLNLFIQTLFICYSYWL